MSGGVPTFDGAAITEMLTNRILTDNQWMAEAAQWAKDNAHYAAELQAYAQQLNDLRSGNYVGLLQNLAGTYFTQGGAMSGMLFGTYGDADGDSAAKQFLGDKHNACSNGVKGEENTVNFKACNAARNLQAKSMQDMKVILGEAQLRTKKIQELINESKRDGIKPGELQQKQIEMMGMQAMLQNDLAKLQLTLEMHKRRQELYQQEQRDLANAVINGNGKAISLEGVLGGLH